MSARELLCIVAAAPPGTPGPAIAAVRAGAIGVVDAEWRDPDDALRALDALAGADGTDRERVGVRLRPHRAAAFAAARAGHERIGWAIVTDVPGDRVGAGALERLRAVAAHVLVETASADLGAALARDGLVDGVVARGNEAGGWVGEETVPVLVQRLRAAGVETVIARGAIGPAAAATLRVLGAAGVMVGDETLLMEESVLGPAERAALRAADAVDAGEIEVAAGARCRVVTRPGAGRGRELAEGAATRPEDVGAAVRAADGAMGFGDAAWPVGQALALAPALAGEHVRTGRLVRALTDGSSALVGAAAERAVLAAGAPLARAHGTTYPVVQGPMTRVSDRPEFAEAVAEAGGLPLLALALLPGPRVERLLAETAERLAGRPWGVGILGFVPAELREAQMRAVAAARPAVGLIAGGRPSQAAALEEAGIATYLHVPTPALLERFLADGARRFVLEGRECGGHVGPLASLPLWERQSRVLLADDRDLSDVDVLLAGGIHDGATAGAAAALAEPLAAAGAGVGVLMGTAYLFTREAVATGAVVPGFQAVARECAGTVTLESGPGHATRCAVTPFAEEFDRERHRATGEEEDPARRRERLERLNLGRLRLATKGLRREDGDALAEVDEPVRRAEGLHMMGQVAALRAEETSLADLHAEVSAGSAAALAAAAPSAAPARPGHRPVPPIAIVGMSTILPGAQDPEELWDLVLAGRSAIGPIPRRRFDARLHGPDGPAGADEIAAAVGGFVDPVPFDPLRFGMAPAALPHVDAAQLLALEAARRALADAGLDLDEPARERTAVILGMSMATGDMNHAYTVRAQLPSILGPVPDDVLARLPGWSEESFPGLLGNVTAGRIANRLDLGGSNLVVDAACASSLAAVEIAVEELASGRSDVVLTGGVDAELNPTAYVCFTASKALSPEGRARVFDRDADGIVIGEGAVVLALKRLSDAERDGDRVYATIRGIAGSSDGRARGLTAPRGEGQRRAMRRCYEGAGVSPASVALYEAHGTGTALGDRTEAGSFAGLMREEGAGARSCAIGSLKGGIGHTKAVAGAAALAKAALALRHATVPPHRVDAPIEEVSDPDGPLTLLDAPRPWQEGAAPRRAAVSAFGFGGTNFHAVLEEHRAPVAAAAGAERWPAELVVLRDADAAALAARARSLAEAAGAPGARLRDLALGAALDARSAPAGAAGAVVAADPAELARRLGALADGLTAGRAGRLADGVWAPAGITGRVGFLLSGQGAAAPGMAREAAVFLPELRAAIAAADAVVAAGAEDGDPALADLVLGSGLAGDAERAARAEAIARTDVAQPAIAAVSLGLLDLLARVGVAPDALAGHSFGELVALYAAGALSREDLLILSRERGRAMHAADPGRGAMAAVAAAPEEVAAHLPERGDVVVACRNAPRQTVVSGPREDVDALVTRLRESGLRARRLPVGGAFHSPLVAPAAEVLRACLQGVPLAPPRIPVHANRDGAPYPADAAQVAERLAAQVTEEVRFADAVERMHADGVRLFVEVGPGGHLAAMVGAVLADRPHLAVPMDRPGGGLATTLESLAALWSAGVELDAAALATGRDAPARVVVDRSSPYRVDGGGVLHGDGEEYLGREAPLTLEAAGERSVTASVPAPERALAEAAAVLEGPRPVEAAPPAADPDAAVRAYDSYQRTMRRFLEVQESVMSAFLGAPAAPAAGPPAPPAAAPPVAERAPSPPAPAPVPDARGPVDLMQTLVGLLAERTGFPAHMLGPDVDLEGDLGIDSIKRVEVLGALGEVTGATDLFEEDAIERLLLARTLRETVALLDERGEGAVGPADDAPPPPPPPVPQAPPATASMHAERAPLAEESAPVRGAVVVAGGGSAASALAAGLRERGLDAHALSGEHAGTPPAREDLERLREARGPVGGLVWLGGLAAHEADAPASARASERAGATLLLDVLQALSPDLAAGGRVLAVSEMGGSYGRDGRIGPAGPLAGAVLGAVNVVAAEWAPELARAVDLPAGLDPDEMAEIAAAELAAPGPDREIGYPDRERTRFVARATPDDEESRPEAESEPPRVLLATGGARGITAESVLALAGPETTVICVGRTPHPDGAGPDPAPDARDEAALRGAIAAAEPGIGPQELSRRARSVLAARELRENLTRFAGAAGDVRYVTADVRDAEALAAALGPVLAETGPADTVLHGAGLIEDRRIERKTPESLARVFDTKVDGLEAVLATVDPEALRRLILFTSVSGRFGTPGQLDYAAANEVLNRMAWGAAERWPWVRVRAINWGPWSGGGMADDAVLGRLAERGIAAIDPDAGRAALHGAVAGEGPVELIVGSGPWLEAE